MPRIARAAPGGKVYHVLNRGNGRARLFHKEADYAAFQKLLFEVREKVPVRVLAWCLMPNHWHLVLSPTHKGDIPEWHLLKPQPPVVSTLYVAGPGADSSWCTCPVDPSPPGARGGRAGAG